MLKKCYSIGKAYYQTSDNEAGYQKRVQLTLGVFGFDHGCSVHTKIHGYLYRLVTCFLLPDFHWRVLSFGYL